MVYTGAMAEREANRRRVREVGLAVGILPTGAQNAITDVAGLRIGHRTIVRGEAVRTGVTAVMPHDGDLFQEKVPAGIHVGNGFGKLIGATQVEELGEIETPIVLTNTLVAPRVADALIEWVLDQPGNEKVRSVNPVIGETNDGVLNDIRGRHVTREDVFAALDAARGAKSGAVAEGCVGAGTGTVAFGWKGGIGTASRVIPPGAGASTGCTVGVLVQSNFGGVLTIGGAPVGVELEQYYLRDQAESADGSVMIIVATDAPLDARNLKRLAFRTMLGLGRTGASASNGSGDYAIAFSTRNRIRAGEATRTLEVLSNEAMSPLFLAAIEATEEAIYNSLFMATTMTGRGGQRVEAIPIEKVVQILRRHALVK